MKYLSTFDAAEKWGISPRRVLNLVKDGKIPEAVRIGSRWMIPENAEKPMDGRTKAGRIKSKQTADSFRYPIFEYRDISSFHPPLSEEELRLKQVAEAFHTCRFEEADRLMGDFPETAEDKYQRIHALYEGCMIDIFICNTGRFLARYGRLRTELQGDFPHKTELQEYLHEVDATLGMNAYYNDEFRVIPGYKYHDSFLPRLASLCTVSMSSAGKIYTPADLRAHEMNCIFLEKSDAYVDLQTLHTYLGAAYALMERTEEMTYHFEKALSLAERHNLYYVPAIQYFYMRKLFGRALSGFSDDFRQHLESVSDDIHKRYLCFTDAISVNSIYKLLSRDEYIYLYYAVQGYTNKEVAAQLHSSEGAVGKKYGEIYASLGVSDKNEMIELYHKSVSESALG